MKIQFTKPQQLVIQSHHENILVSAAAGSGKTAVLVERILQMISRDQDPVDIDRLLVVTFTKAAAKEMESRFASLMGQKSMVSFGTFHAVFFKILRSVYNYNIDNIIREERH